MTLVTIEFVYIGLWTHEQTRDVAFDKGNNSLQIKIKLVGNVPSVVS